MIEEIKFKDHDEWLAIRHQYIGGSDAAAVIGLSPYKSAYTLWAEKTNKIPPFEGNILTRVGAHLEDLIAQLFEEETGKKVRRKNATMVNDLYPYACANIDRAIVGENAFLEIKTTTSIPAIKQINKAEEFPELYYAQVVHYMAVGNYDHAFLAVLINCRDLKIFELKRDQAEIDALMNAEAEFWKHVQDDTPPTTDGSESTSDTLRELYPNDDGECLDLSNIAEEIKDYNELSASIKNLEKLRDEKANAIKEYMKNAPEGRSEDFCIKYATQERKTFDTKAFENAHPGEDLSNYYKTSSFRVFKVTANKKGNKDNG